MKAKTWLRKAHPQALRGQPFKIENWEGGYAGSLIGLGYLKKETIMGSDNNVLSVRYKVTFEGAARFLKVPRNDLWLFA